MNVFVYLLFVLAVLNGGFSLNLDFSRVASISNQDLNLMFIWEI